MLDVLIPGTLKIVGMDTIWNTLMEKLELENASASTFKCC